MKLLKKFNQQLKSGVISGLRNFFDYLIFEDYRSDNPTDLIETPKIGRKLPDTLSENEINDLINCYRFKLIRKENETEPF